MKSPDAVREKQHEEEAETAKLVAKGTPVARMNTGIDGAHEPGVRGQDPRWQHRTVGWRWRPRPAAGVPTTARARATIPAGVNPPRGQVTSPDEPLLASTASDRIDDARRLGGSRPHPSPTKASSAASPARSASATPTADTTRYNRASHRRPGSQAEAAASRRLAFRRPAAAPKTDIKTDIKTDTKQAAARPPLKPTVTDTAAAPAPAAPAAGNSMVAGAQPIVSANSFDSRFSAAK
ncbi:MAG: hypothetical protein WDN50_25455 [Bradyrhizobium sp.]